MALWELDEFQGPQFLGFVRSIPEPTTFLGQTWLPNRTIDDLAFEYIKGVNERPVMAHILGFDSEAPIHGRPGMGERVSGELPPIKRKAKFSEKEIIRFLQPRAGTADKQTAVNSVYQLTGQLVQSIQARVEWLRMQALSEDKVTYDEGGVIFEFDYGLNDEYQLDLVAGEDGAGSAVSELTGAGWNVTASANPVVDLQYICDKVEEETGQRPPTMVCSRKVVGYLLNNVAIRQLIRGTSAPSTVLTLGELNTLFDLYGLPSIVTYDLTLRNENADGTFTDVKPLAQNKAFLVPSTTVDLGETLWGPTAESRSLIGQNLGIPAPGVFGVTYGVEEPPSEWTKVVATAFPSLPGAANLAQLTVAAA